MRASIVGTILWREWYETVRNRLLMSTILVPPIALTIAPIVLAAAVGDSVLPPELAAQVRLPEAGMVDLLGGRARGSLRSPAVPRVLPADAGVHPTVDRDVFDHRRETGPLPRAGARRPDPDLRAAGRQGDRCARAGCAVRLGDLRGLRRARITRIRAGVIRRRHRSVVACGRVPARDLPSGCRRSWPG